MYIAAAVPTSISILLDGSGSVSFEDWIKQLNFTIDILNAYNLSSSRTANVIQFSNNAFIEFTCAQTATTSNLADDVNNLIQIEGSASLKKALDKANQALNDDTCGLATNRQDIVFLITESTEGFFQTALLTSAETLKSRGAIIVAIAIGNNVNLTELALVTGSVDQVIARSSFSDLDVFNLSSMLNTYTKPTRKLFSLLQQQYSLPIAISNS